MEEDNSEDVEEDNSEVVKGDSSELVEVDVEVGVGDIRGSQVDLVELLLLLLLNSKIKYFQLRERGRH